MLLGWQHPLGPLPWAPRVPPALSPWPLSSLTIGHHGDEDQEEDHGQRRGPVEEMQHLGTPEPP